jgi:putative spermidine/putrescine transport system ATP-binding protein
MVFQNYALFPHMTVFENIAFPLRLRRVPANEIAKQVESMLETIRLPDIRDRMPNQLSGGQQQRVALARAAIYGPNVLLMDEPLGALDKNLREQMQYEIKEFHRQINATVLYVTHDQDEAAAMSDRLGIMNGGRIVQHGTPRELYEMPRNAFVAQFLGSANFFEVSGKPTGNGECIKVPISGGRVLKAINPAGVAVAPNSAVICVRPESISLEKEVAKASHDDLNRIEGRVVDAVYTAGTFRYGVETTMGETVVVRMPSVRKMEMLAPGEKVSLGWPANSTLVIQKD